MKIHLTNSSPHIAVYKSLENHPYTLLSFAYKNLEPKYVSTWVDTEREIILDSGAFTAWSVGKEVKLKDYCKWAKRFTHCHQSKIQRIRYINLDKIPGKKGVKATPEELKFAEIQSMQNADYLRVNGIDAIEVFHQDEDFKVLDRLVERRGERLIAISPRNDVSTQKRKKWLTEVFCYCIKRFGKDNIPPAHGLAVTSESLCYSFPFYSVDSSTWTQCLRFGTSKASGLPKLPKKNHPDYENIYNYALSQEVKYYQRMQKNATYFWQREGISWDE